MQTTGSSPLVTPPPQYEIDVRCMFIGLSFCLFVLCVQVSGALVAVVFCVTLNVLILTIPEYHMMDMNIISLVTISLLMVSKALWLYAQDFFCRSPSVRLKARGRELLTNSSEMHITVLR